MNTTYAQKSSTVQKASSPKAASVLDSSSQGESLQRKADMVNNAVQCHGFGESFLNSWYAFRMYIGWGLKSFKLLLNGTFYKFNIGDKDTSFIYDTMNSEEKVINLNKKHVELIEDNPIALKQIVLHEIGHSRYTQKEADETFVELVCRGEMQGLIDTYKKIVDEIHSDVYAFSILLNDEQKNHPNGVVDFENLYSRINLENRPKNWIEARCGYPPVDEDERMFRKWYDGNYDVNQFESIYESLIRNVMMLICKSHEVEIQIGFWFRNLNSMKKGADNGDLECSNVLEGMLRDGEKKFKCKVSLEDKKVYYGGQTYDVSLLVK